MRPAHWFLTACFFLLPATAVADIANPPPSITPTSASLNDVLALNKQSGGTPLSIAATRVVEWSYRVAGFDGTQRQVAAGNDYLVTSAHGPFVSSWGRRNRQSWRQDENGLTLLMSGLRRPGDLDRQAYSSALRGISQAGVTLAGESVLPVPSYVIELNPPGGHAEWLYLEKKRGLLVRKVEQAPDRRVVTTWDDFRSVNGAIVPFHYIVRDGDVANDQDWTCTSARVNVLVNLNDLDIPPDRRQLVTFPRGTTTVDLPASLIDGHIVIHAMINGRGVDLLLDSGASGIVIDKSLADSLGIKRYGKADTMIGGTVEFSSAIVPEIRVGELTMKDVVVDTIPWSDRPNPGMKIIGLMGFDFLASVGLRIDYETGTVDAIAPGAMVFPKDAFQLPIKLDDGAPMVSARINNAQGSQFIIDTGASVMVVFSRFARAHADDVTDMGLGREMIQTNTAPEFSVVGGSVNAVPTQVRAFRLGEVLFQDMVVYVAIPESHFDFEDADGLIGYQFLHYFTVYFDYAGGRLGLAPNGNLVRGRN